MKDLNELEQAFTEVLNTEGILRNYQYRAYTLAVKLVNKFTKEGILEFTSVIRGEDPYDNRDIWICKINCSNPKEIIYTDVTGKVYDSAYLEVNATDIIDEILHALKNIVMLKNIKENDN